MRAKKTAKARVLTLLATTAVAGIVDVYLLGGQYANRPTNSIFNVDSLNRGSGSLYGPSQGLPGGQDELPSAAITVAETLKTAGYATAHFGKYHVGDSLPDNGLLEQGFDANFGGGPSGGPGSYHASKGGGVLRIVSVKGDSALSRCDLTSKPVFDGIVDGCGQAIYLAQRRHRGVLGRLASTFGATPGPPWAVENVSVQAVLAIYAHHSPSGRVGLSGPERAMCIANNVRKTPHPAATASDLPKGR